MLNKNKSLTKTIILSFYLAIISLSANAQEQSAEPKQPINKLATQEEAKALFDWAMVYLKINDRDIAYKAFNQIDGKFTHRDLYISCLEYHKVWLVMGVNPSLIGNSAENKRDLNGKDFVEEFVSVAKINGAGTVSYTYKNPITEKEQLKTSFIQKVAEYEFCGMRYYNS